MNIKHGLAVPEAGVCTRIGPAEFAHWLLCGHTDNLEQLGIIPSGFKVNYTKGYSCLGLELSPRKLAGEQLSRSSCWCKCPAFKLKLQCDIWINHKGKDKIECLNFHSVALLVSFYCYYFIPDCLKWHHLLCLLSYYPGLDFIFFILTTTGTAPSPLETRESFLVHSDQLSFWHMNKVLTFVVTVVNSSRPRTCSSSAMFYVITFFLLLVGPFVLHHSCSVHVLFQVRC